MKMVRGSRLLNLFSIVFLCSLLFINDSLARRRFGICGGGGGGCGIQSGGCGGGSCQVVQDVNNQQVFQDQNLDAINQFQAVVGAGQFGFNQFGFNNQFGINQFGVNQFGVNQFGVNPFLSAGQFGVAGGLSGNQLAPTLGGLSEVSGVNPVTGVSGVTGVTGVSGVGGFSGLNMNQISLNMPGVRSLGQISRIDPNTIAINGIRVPPGAVFNRSVNGAQFFFDANGNLLNPNGSVAQLGGQQGGQVGPGGVTNPAVPGSGGTPQQPQQPQPPTPQPQQPGGATTPTAPQVHDVGVQNTQPPVRPPGPPEASKFSKWKKLYGDQEKSFDKEKVDKQVAKLTGAGIFNEFTVKAFPMECASQGAPDAIKKAALVMITEQTNWFGTSPQTYFMIKSDQEAAIKDASTKDGQKKLWEEAKKVEKALKPDGSGALVRPFQYANENFKEHTEIQHRVRPVVKDGEITGFTAAQLLRHKDDVKPDEPAKRWGTNDARDVQMYCKTGDIAKPASSSGPKPSVTPTPSASPTPSSPPTRETDAGGADQKAARLAAAKTAFINCKGCHSGNRYGFKVADDGSPSFPKPSTKLGRTLTPADVAKAVKGELEKVGNMADEGTLNEEQIKAIEAWSKD